MDDLRSAWTRLGFSFAVTPCATAPDLESVLVSTLQQARADTRLFQAAATWLHRFGMLVDGHRLTRRLDRLGAEQPPSALLACLVTASSSPHLKGLLGRCERLHTEEILFSVMEGPPVLRAKVTDGARPEFRRWGYLTDEIELKMDALRPTSWVLRMNPTLQTRALLGANLRAAIMDRLLRDSPPASISRLATDLGRPYASVHSATTALLATGLLESEPRGRSLFLRVPEDVATWLAAYPPALTPRERKNAVIAA